MMKKLVILILLFNASLFTFANPIVICDTTNIDGKRVLYLAADDFENGFNYGLFFGEQIKNMFENYVITKTFGGAYGYNLARDIFDQKFTVDEKYIEISQGMILGITAAGVSLYSPTLNDTINYKDVLIANSIPDFTAFFKSWNNKGPGCSELASWGDATLGDPNLNGSTVICRQLDWDNDPLLIENALMIIWEKSSPDRQRITTFGFTGMIGALSGYNESGVVTFQNMGNYYEVPSGNSFYPVNLAQRNGLEAIDYNDDGVCSPRDVTDAVREHNVASTYIITTAGPQAFEPPVEILEIHNSLGDTIRTTAQNPDYFGDNLIATNHFRLLMPPSYCYRYKRISDSLTVSNQVSLERNWNIMKTAGVPVNLQTIQYVPDQHILRFSFAVTGTPAYLLQPSEIFTDTLYLPVGLRNWTKNEKNTQISVYPNPANRKTTILLNFKEPGTFNCFVTDVTGNIVFDFGKLTADNEKINLTWNTKNISNGIYFFNLFYSSGISHKQEKAVEKIMISH